MCVSLGRTCWSRPWWRPWRTDSWSKSLERELSVLFRWPTFISISARFFLEFKNSEALFLQVLVCPYQWNEIWHDLDVDMSCCVEKTGSTGGNMTFRVWKGPRRYSVTLLNLTILYCVAAEANWQQGSPAGQRPGGRHRCGHHSHEWTQDLQHHNSTQIPGGLQQRPDGELYMWEAFRWPSNTHTTSSEPVRHHRAITECSWIFFCIWYLFSRETSRNVKHIQLNFIQFSVMLGSSLCPPLQFTFTYF